MATKDGATSLNSNYEYVGIRGQGHFAFVSHYRKKANGADVAVKRLKAESRSNADHLKRFKKEITFLKQLAPHPSIIQLIEDGTDDKGPFYIMPFATLNLHKYIKASNDSLSLQDRISLFDPILSAIEHAHSKNILHRDISPKNVLLFIDKAQLTIAMCDFGLGKDVQSTSGHTNSSVDNYGHAYYVAPEQRDSLKSATTRSDIFSLGKLLHFVMTGRDPDSYHPCDFGPVIRRATESSPDKRFQSIQDFSSAYDGIKRLLRPEDAADHSILITDLVKAGTEMNWHQFHQLAVEAVVTRHPYEDYIKPIMGILSDAEALQSYIVAIGSDVHRFATRFVEKLHEVYSMVGWPFSATDSFGRFLDTLFSAVDNDDTKLLCLVELWYIGFKLDQWDAQKLIRRKLGNGLIPSQLYTEFASHIASCGFVVPSGYFDRVKMPLSIKRAIESVTKSE